MAVGPVCDLFGVGGIPEFADFGQGSKADAIKGGMAKPVDLVAVVEGLGAQIGGENALCEIVVFGEPVAVRCREFAGIPQVIKGLFVRWSAPHFAAAFQFCLKIEGGERAFIRDAAFDVIL